MIMAQRTFQLAGRFKLVARSAARGDRVVAEFDNLILDAGLNRLGTGGAAAYCQVGTGTGAPSASETALVNRIASTNTIQSDWSQSYVAGPPAYVTASKTYRFATGVASGILTEVGVGWASSGSLFSRALIVDGSGNPTSVEILSDETLDVTYTIRIYVPADITGSVTISGTAYGFTSRLSQVGVNFPRIASIIDLGFVISGAPYQASSYTGGIGPTTGLPSGTSSSGTATFAIDAYSNNSLQRTFTMTMGLNVGNVAGGIKSLLVALQPVGSVFLYAFQVEFSSNIPKDATKTFTMSFRISWARRP